ncbi:hypothetical protein ST47_g3331 [Ascochyta rabiei]|uniref:Uncharacterized protein n=1 Tax=Didymella rabiei TaxID=5454 RepID=A0A163I2Q5_DIDRA|nr:hypothetical protein ST47_g3331 [Ascochyta rabiei]
MAPPQSACISAEDLTKFAFSNMEQDLDFLTRADCLTGSEIGQTYETGCKPIGTPQDVLDVFFQDGSYFVKVAIHRVYEATDLPPRTVREFLPHVFEVGKFKRTFSISEHGLVMDQINEKIEELESHKMKDKAKDFVWKQRLAEWLGHLLVCLPSRCPASPRQDGTKRRESITSNGCDSKICSDGSLANHKLARQNPVKVEQCR